jgi:predicted nucleic acid-binding Zn ribbon protein
MRDDKWSDKICNIEDVNVVRSLSDDAIVMCAKCGAKAHEAARLCDPVRISDPGGA